MLWVLRTYSRQSTPIDIGSIWAYNRNCVLNSEHTTEKCVLHYHSLSNHSAYAMMMKSSMIAADLVCLPDRLRELDAGRAGADRHLHYLHRTAQSRFDRLQCILHLRLLLFVGFPQLCVLIVDLFVNSTELACEHPPLLLQLGKGRVHDRHTDMYRGDKQLSSDCAVTVYVHSPVGALFK